VTTLADFTTEQIRGALEAALKAGDMPAAASLVAALATREPAEAALIVALVKALAAEVAS